MRWRDDPVVFVRDNFGVEPDAWQAEALRSFASPNENRVALKASAGPGKTSVLAWCAWNFLSCYGERGEHPKGAATAVTGDNLKDNLWPELAKWHSRSPFLRSQFTWTKERVFANDFPETWFISARTFSKTANPEEQGRTLSGLHSKYLLYLIDESGDISPSVLRSAEQGLSNCKFGKILQAGNPTSLSGMLYESVVNQASAWRVITINGDPDNPGRSLRVDATWAAEQIKLHGRDNPWVMAYILGQFPPASINSLLGIEEVEASMKRAISEDKFDFSQKRIGVDVSRFGDDRTVIFPRQGLMAFKPVEMRNARSNDIAARVVKAKADWGSEVEFIDATGGYGAGVEDSMIQAGLTPIPVQFAGKANDPRFFNKRTEIWFLMAEWVKRGGCLPEVPALRKELTAPTYTFVGGKFRLEEKDQVKKRIGVSPDYADALALSFSFPEMPKEFRVPGVNIQKKQEAVHEWDPMEELVALR